VEFNMNHWLKRGMDAPKSAANITAVEALVKRHLINKRCSEK